MKRRISELLMNFSILTHELCSCIEKDEFDSLANLYDERQLLIDELSHMDYDIEEFKHIASELDLPQLEKKLNELMRGKHLQLKTLMNKLSLSKNVNANYNKNSYIDSIFLNKKI